MKYISLDLETTGSNPWTCAPLMVSMVLEDTTVNAPVDQLPHATFVVDPWAKDVDDDLEFITEPTAMLMNGWLLAKIEHARGMRWDKLQGLCGQEVGDAVIKRARMISCPAPVISLTAMDDELYAFLVRCGFRDEKVTVAGKNVGGFDAQILKRLCPQTFDAFHYSYLDVGSMGWDPSQDSKVPSLQKLAERHGIQYDAHDAYGDAKAVIELIRRIKK